MEKKTPRTYHSHVITSSSPFSAINKAETSGKNAKKTEGERPSPMSSRDPNLSLANHCPHLIFKPVDPRFCRDKGAGQVAGRGASREKKENSVMIGRCRRWKMIVGRWGVPL